MKVIEVQACGNCKYMVEIGTTGNCSRLFNREIPDDLWDIGKPSWCPLKDKEER